MALRSIWNGTIAFAGVFVIEAMAADRKPDSHEDRYRKGLQKIVSDKRKGRTIDVESGPGSEPDAVPDPMAALQKALADAKGDGTSARGAAPKRKACA